MLKIERKTKNLDRLMRKLAKLRMNQVETGYFREQKKHSESGLSYATMMNLHEYGFYGDIGYIPQRPVRQITTVYIKANWGRASKAISQYLFHKKGIEYPLDWLGKHTGRYAVSVFGNTTLLESNSQDTIDIKGFNSPLVDSGELRNNWSYKSSADKIIRNVSYG